MRKSTLFISVVLTAFLIATSFGAVSAYQRMIQSRDAAPSQAASQPVVAEVLPTTAPTSAPETVVISPDQATLIASNFLGRTDVYSVEVVDYQGVSAFLVTFSSGDLVYVSSDGTVLANTQLAPVVIAAPKNQSKGKNSNDDGNTSNNNNSSGGNEDHSNDHHESEGNDD